MKSNTTITALNFVLAALVILGVLFALFSIFRARDLRSITPVSMQVNGKVLMIQSLVKDVNNYNQKAKNPELTTILHNFETQVSSQK